MTWPIGPPWIALLCFEDIRAGLRNGRLRREIRPLMSDGWLPEGASRSTIVDVFSGFMLFRDPPKHTRLRSTANLAVTPRRVEGTRTTITALANDLADRLVTSGEPKDLIRAFAFPLPIMVISEMLGIPREDLPRFRDWSMVIAAAIDIRSGGNEDFAAQADLSAAELVEYLTRIVEERRVRPRADLISSLIQAGTTEGGIATEELISTCILLLGAGHETTVNLITNGMLALLSNPHQWQVLIEDLGLAKKATEEVLRYDSPVQMTDRLAHEDVTIAGETIPRGTNAQLVLGSANRDPRVVENPDRLDIRRDIGRIMSLGLVFCLGAQWHDSRARSRPGLALHGLEELLVTARSL